MEMRAERQDGGVIAFARAMAHGRGAAATLAAALVMAGAVIEGFGILMIVPILGVVIGQAALPAWLPGAGAVMTLPPLARLAVLLGLFVAAMGLRGGVLYARDTVLVRMQLAFAAAQRGALIAALGRAAWPRVAALDHAQVANVVGSESGRVATAAHFLIQALVAVVLLAIQLAIAALLSWPLALAAALVLGGGLAVTAWRARGIRDMGGAVVQSASAMMGSAQGFLGGLKAAKAEGTTAGFVAEFLRHQQALHAVQQGFAATQARTRLRYGVGSALAASAVVLAGVVTATPAPALITLILLFARMGGPALQLTQSMQNIQFALPSYAMTAALTRRLADAADGDAVAAADVPTGSIRLTGARYAHRGGQGGIAVDTLEIAEGRFVGIVGPSGAGKTTLVDLIAGLLTPDAGDVRVGDTVLRGAALAAWRRAVGYVPQDGYLFHDSIARNLGIAGREDDPVVARVLALTGADAVIAALPQGLATVVGERGSRLSGGERQRIALARALLRTPRLLVLDEATNAIDVAGEAAVLEALAMMPDRPTILMIAHRRESLARCDHVIGVEGGRLVAGSAAGGKEIA